MFGRSLSNRSKVWIPNAVIESIGLSVNLKLGLTVSELLQKSSEKTIKVISFLFERAFKSRSLDQHSTNTFRWPIEAVSLDFEKFQTIWIESDLDYWPGDYVSEDTLSCRRSGSVLPALLSLHWNLFNENCFRRSLLRLKLAMPIKWLPVTNRITISAVPPMSILDYRSLTISSGVTARSFDERQSLTGWFRLSTGFRLLSQEPQFKITVPSKRFS